MFEYKIDDHFKLRIQSLNAKNIEAPGKNTLMNIQFSQISSMLNLSARKCLGFTNF